MPTKKKPEAFVAPPIYDIRDHRVVLDADLAKLYGVTTKQFNQALKRNRARFPMDFAFQLTAAESDTASRSQPALGGTQTAAYKNVNSRRSQFVTASQRFRNVKFRPWVFTEHGALMAANVLRSPRALEMSIFVIRAFVRMREELAANATILRRLAEIDKTLLVHDSALRDVFRKLIPLLSPPPGPPKPKIGFHPGNR
jgi:hypothetical protein